MTVRTSSSILVVLALTILAPSVAGQAVGDPQQERSRTERRLRENRDRVDRLVDLRFRHDVGLPAEADPGRPVAAPMSTADKERKLRELTDQDGYNASLMSRYNAMRKELTALQAEAAARAQDVASNQYVVVPSVGDGRARPAMPRPAVEMAPQRKAAGDDVPSVVPPLPAGASPAVKLTRVKAQIRGSEDHLKVAQALFRAGQELMDEAQRFRDEHDADTAIELDGRAKQRLDRAIAELEPLLAGKEPSFAALFCQGRCLELLFRYSERYEGLSLGASTRQYQQREQEVRDPFLAIAARDVRKEGAAGAVERLGSWGQAANAAVEHFRWLNQHGGYVPVVPIDSITWWREKQQ